MHDLKNTFENKIFEGMYCVQLHFQVRTPHNSTKQNNIRILYGNPVARELLEVELDDKDYKFKMHGLVTNPNYTNKRMVMLLFINNRLVDSTCKYNVAHSIFIYFNSFVKILMFMNIYLQQSVRC